MYPWLPTLPLPLSRPHKFWAVRLINQTKSVENVIFASTANGAFGFLCATQICHTHAYIVILVYSVSMFGQSI